MQEEISWRSTFHGPLAESQQRTERSKSPAPDLEACEQSSGLCVGYELQQILDLAVEVSTEFVHMLSAGVPSGLVEQTRQGVPGNSGLLGNLAHGDVATLLELPLRNQFLELESNHRWNACTKTGIFAPGVDIVKFRVILGANAPYMEQSDHEWNWRLA